MDGHHGLASIIAPILDSTLQHPLFFDALQAPLQKIALQRLLADFPLQFRYPILIGSLLTQTGKGLFG